jgi:hypothetical protein
MVIALQQVGPSLMAVNMYRSSWMQTFLRNISSVDQIPSWKLGANVLLYKLIISFSLTAENMSESDCRFDGFYFSFQAVPTKTDLLKHLDLLFIKCLVSPPNFSKHQTQKYFFLIWGK